MKYNKAKEDVSKQTELLKNYKNAYNISKKLNDLVQNEDNLYKQALHDREQKLEFYQHEESREQNKFSDNLQKANISKLFNNLNIYLETTIVAKDKIKSPAMNIKENNDDIFAGIEEDDEEKNNILDKLVRENQVAEESKVKVAEAV